MTKDKSSKSFELNVIESEIAVCKDDDVTTRTRESTMTSEYSTRGSTYTVVTNTSTNSSNNNSKISLNDFKYETNKKKLKEQEQAEFGLVGCFDVEKNGNPGLKRTSTTYSVWDEVPAIHPTEFNSFNKIWKWILAWAVPGLGMFNESFLVFSTGQIKTLWDKAYPSCWQPDEDATCPGLIKCDGLFNTNATTGFDASYCNADRTYPSKVLCEKWVLDSISYTEFAGIMLGMLILALVADKLGRRFGSNATSFTMVIGAILITLSIPFFGLKWMFVWFTIAYMIYGFGVGGEYPISGSSAAERSQLNNPASERGREIALTFSMQGVGAVVGSVVIIILLLVTKQVDSDCGDVSHNSEGYSENNLNIVWRVTYAIGAFLCIIVFLYRYFFLEESKVFENIKEMQETNNNSDESQQKYYYDLTKTSTRYYVAFRHYGSRILGTAGCWFVWDVAFYGNKLFSGPIFAALVPGGDLVTINGYILLNNLVALLGYWAAAAVIDNKYIGRRNLQLVGFLMVTILFGLSAGLFGTIDGNILLFLYIFSSFWGQCGPNVVSYISPAELYPTALRSICHGISAFCGKAGALVATILFGYLSTTEIFTICAVVSAFGCGFTFFFLADVTGLELTENDRYFEALILKPGQPNDLGEVVKPEGCVCREERYLSRFEIFLKRFSSY